MTASFGAAAAELAGIAACLLGWRPDDFWSATPAELATALRLQTDEGAAADRETLAALIRRFPDE